MKVSNQILWSSDSGRELVTLDADQTLHVHPASIQPEDAVELWLALFDALARSYPAGIEEAIANHESANTLKKVLSAAGTRNAS